MCSVFAISHVTFYQQLPIFHHSKPEYEIIRELKYWENRIMQKAINKMMGGSGE
jgi:hypothetical protein